MGIALKFLIVSFFYFLDMFSFSPEGFLQFLVIMPKNGICIKIPHFSFFFLIFLFSPEIFSQFLVIIP